MATLEQLYQEIQKLGQRLDDAIANAKLNPKQITIVHGLSDICHSLGAISAGEFFALFQGSDPNDLDAIGTFMSAAGRIFNSEKYHIGGVYNGSLMWGANSITGKLEAGAGTVLLSNIGVSIYDDSETPVEVARLGDLTGFLSLGHLSGTGPYYGIGFGNVQEYMTYDEVNGLQLYGVSLNDREILTQDRYYYVSTDGDDANDGLSFDHPFLTIQRAIDVVTVTLDQRNYNVYIEVIDEASTTFTVTDAISLNKGVGTGSITIKKSTEATTTVEVTGDVATSIFNLDQKETTYILDGLKISNTTGDGVHVERGNIELTNIEFGACGDAHIEASNGGEVRITGSYTVTGNATRHWHSNYNGKIMLMPSATLEITLDPVTFTTFADASVSGKIYLPSTDISFVYTSTDDVTGKRYNSYCNSVIFTSSKTLPGNSTGTVSVGGVYV